MALKRVPAGYDKEHPQAEYLKFKSWYLEYPIRDKEFEDAEKMKGHSHSKAFAWAGIQKGCVVNR